MSSENDEKKASGENTHGEKKSGIGRRNMLKALAGVPVLGLFGVQVLRKFSYDDRHNVRRQIINELGLNDLLDSVKPVTPSNGDVIRIGIAGFGMRGPQLANALGFMEKKQFDNAVKNGSLDSQIKYGNFNAAITGICDVFDQHAENGLATAGHDIFTGGEIAQKHPVKRYSHYHDMIADPDIDAIIVATPDHHHAQMSIDAIKAGKHVYCEKAVIHREDEIEPLYEAVKNSGLVFQMGHQIPQNAVFQQAKELIRRGMLGDISHIETTTNRNTPHGAWIRHVDNQGNTKPGDEKSIDWKQWLGNAPEVPFSIRRFYNWARYFDYDTGLFGQLFSHEYDAINQLLDIGIPETVVATGGQYYYNDFGQIPDVLHTNFEYPERGLTLTYSANLTSSKTRPRTIYGKEASMTVGGHLTMTPDGNSERYADLLKRGLVDPSRPMIEIMKGSSLESAIDAVSSATTQYYAARGLTSTSIDGREWDVTHLHLKEWLDCIRNGGTPSANIDKAYDEAVTLAMADISYREQCRTRWDPVNRKILRK
ncbi:MAG: Gfo/Idh/MocA family oxidoreductase [Bacteroidales bacterium]|nr:Gfo/Idh/MocA family oxidoreductase [Bacteroidales bacterium]